MYLPRSDFKGRGASLASLHYVAMSRENITTIVAQTSRSWANNCRYFRPRLIYIKASSLRIRNNRALFLWINSRATYRSAHYVAHSYAPFSNASRALASVPRKAPCSYRICVRTCVFSMNRGQITGGPFRWRSLAKTLCSRHT